MALILILAFAISPLTNRRNTEPLMARALKSVYPLPRDKEQLLLYAQVVADGNGMTKADLLIPLKQVVFKQSNQEYGDAMYKGVLDSLQNMGVLQLPKSKGNEPLLTLSPPMADLLQGKEIDGPCSSSLANALLASVAYIHDPYVVDQLDYIYEKIRQYPETQWTRQSMLDAVAHKPKSAKWRANPIHGFKTDIIHAGRTIGETLKWFTYLDILELKSGKYIKTINAKPEEKVRDIFRHSRFEWLLQKIINRCGSELCGYTITDTERKILIGSASKYIGYRYAGGIGPHRKIARRVVKATGKIVDRYCTQTSIKQRPINSDTLIIKMKAYRRELERARQSILRTFSLSPKFSALPSQCQASLNKMTMSELYHLKHDRHRTKAEIQQILTARGTGRYNRALLDRATHGGDPFTIAPDIQPFSWQKECVGIWAKGDDCQKRPPFVGISSAVTGTGKTLMALMATCEFINTYHDAVVSVVVPSKVLMYQWAEEAARLIGLNSSSIGLVGDNEHDDFQSGKKLLIWIVNSAIQNNRMQLMVNRLPQSTKHLCIADECHEYGGEKYSAFLKVRSEGKLAISATPPDATRQGVVHPVIKHMGPIFYRLGYRDAHAQGLIADFQIRYLGLDLKPKERAQYDARTEEIKGLLRDLENKYGDRIGDGNLMARLQMILKDGNKHPVISQQCKIG